MAWEEKRVTTVTTKKTKMEREYQSHHPNRINEFLESVKGQSFHAHPIKVHMNSHFTNAY